MPGLGGHRDDAEVLREQDDARPQVAPGGGAVQQHRHAYRLRDVRRDVGQDGGLVSGEAERVVLAVQAQVSPAHAVRDERRAKRVAQPERAYDLPVPPAGPWRSDVRVLGTGKTLTLRGINVFRIEGDRIVERWGRLDQLDLLRQLGIAPSA